MSNHPYGLRGDPFALPATLSAKDASKLIRRRVRAFNGDGGALFPIDTCDLIHELAGGVPDAMLQLAGRAMRIAADENAPAVSPAHVSRALASAASEAPAAPPAASPATPGERAVRAIDVEIEAAEAAVDAAIAAASTRAEAEASSEAAVDPAIAAQATRADAEPSAETHAEREEGTEVVAATIDFEDPELPPFQPAAFALPTQPSENLDADERDWVSRFIPGPGAAPAPVHAVHARRATAVREVELEPEETLPARRETPAEPLPELAAVFAAHAPKPKFRPAPRRRRRQGGHGLIMAFAAVAVIAFVVRMSLRGNLVAPWSQPEPPARTSATANLLRGPERPPTVRTSRPEATERTVPASRTQAPLTTTREEASTRKTPGVATPTGLVPVPTTAAKPVDSAGQVPAATPRPVAPYGLEVATFIFEDRARMERDRLSASGLKARVVTTVEYGSRVYRVVLSGFVDPAAAERAADSLLTTGAVLQARVIRVP